MLASDWLLFIAANQKPAFWCRPGYYISPTILLAFTFTGISSFDFSHETKIFYVDLLKLAITRHFRLIRNSTEQVS